MSTLSPSARQQSNHQTTMKPTYEELENKANKLAEALTKALTEMTLWQQRAINAERKISIAKIDLQNEIDRLILTRP